MHIGARRLGRKDKKVNLHVGRSEVGPGLEKRPGITGADAQQSLAGEEVAYPGAIAMTPIVDHVVSRDRLIAAELHADLEMVLKIGAYARHVGDHVDTVLGQEIGRPDAGQLQELR